MRGHLPLGNFDSGKYEQNLRSSESTEPNEIEGFVDPQLLELIVAQGV
jgi:hypothetical protein